MHGFNSIVYCLCPCDFMQIDWITNNRMAQNNHGNGNSLQNINLYIVFFCLCHSIPFSLVYFYFQHSRHKMFHDILTNVMPSFQFFKYLLLYFYDEWFSCNRENASVCSKEKYCRNT